MATDGVLVLTGPPCSGKSSAGRLLAGGTYVQVDAVFELLLPGSDRNKDDRKLGYDAAHVLARLLAGRGRFPVLECTYAGASNEPAWCRQWRISRTSHCGWSSSS